MRQELRKNLSITSHNRTHKSEWNVNVLSYTDCESKAAAHSVPGGEAYAFIDSFAAACTLYDELSRILKRRFHITIITDCASPFHVIDRSSRKFQKRFIFDLVSLRKAYYSQKTDNIRWIATADNMLHKFTNCEPTVAYKNYRHQVDITQKKSQ